MFLPGEERDAAQILSEPLPVTASRYTSTAVWSAAREAEKSGSTSS